MTSSARFSNESLPLPLAKAYLSPSPLSWSGERGPRTSDAECDSGVSRTFLFAPAVSLCRAYRTARTGKRKWPSRYPPLLCLPAAERVCGLCGSCSKSGFRTAAPELSHVLLVQSLGSSFVDRFFRSFVSPPPLPPLHRRDLFLSLSPRLPDVTTIRVARCSAALSPAD